MSCRSTDWLDDYNGLEGWRYLHRMLKSTMLSAREREIRCCSWAPDFIRQWRLDGNHTVRRKYFLPGFAPHFLLRLHGVHRRCTALCRRFGDTTFSRKPPHRRCFFFLLFGKKLFLPFLFFAFRKENGLRWFYG